MELGDAVQQLAKILDRNWLVLPFDLSLATRAAEALGWMGVSVREGEEERSVLRPQKREEAHANSLSSRYGLGAQPLHTDGAHHLEPPAVLLLQALTVTATPTAIWAPSPDQLASGDHWSQGIFTIRAGRRTRLTPALANGRLRFDPGCMEASDTLAQTVVAEVAAARSKAGHHHWTNTITTLAINNRTTLHAREAVPDSDRSRSIARRLYQIGSA